MATYLDWFKMSSKLPRDPKWKRLSLKEKVAFIEAVCEIAEQETDGVLHSRPSKVGDGWVREGLAESTDGGYFFPAYLKWNPSKGDLDEQRRQTKERVTRYRERYNGVTNAVSTEVVPNSLSTSSSKSGVVDGSQEPTSGNRDAAYEAFGDCWQGDWHGLPKDARGRINEALGSLRNMTENKGRSDSELADEIRRRWDHATAWQPEWVWTPQTFLRYWRRLAKPVPTSNGSRGERLVKEILA